MAAASARASPTGTIARSPPRGRPRAPGPPGWPPRADPAPGPRPAPADPTPRPRGSPPHRPRRARRARCRSGPRARPWCRAPSVDERDELGGQRTSPPRRPAGPRPPSPATRPPRSTSAGPSVDATGPRTPRAAGRAGRRAVHGPRPLAAATARGRLAGSPAPVGGCAAARSHRSRATRRPARRLGGTPACSSTRMMRGPAARLVEDQVVHGDDDRRPAAAAPAHHGQPAGLESVGVDDLHPGPACQGLAQAAGGRRRPSGCRLVGMGTTTSIGRIPSRTPSGPGP